MKKRNGIATREITVDDEGVIYITLVKREVLPDDYGGDLNLVRHHDDGYYFPYPAGLVDVYNPDGTLKHEGLVILSAPRTIRVNREGDMYIIEGHKGCLWGRSHVIKFARTGGRISEEGELWRRSGVHPVVPVHCGCLTGQMDLDESGNIFVTVMRGFYIQVLDANGNAVARFGEYGNLDCKGPNSASPNPAIPFNVIRGVAVAEGKLYVTDYGNRRIIKCDLEYRTTKSQGFRLSANR
jgi:hypothetical protein